MQFCLFERVCALIPYIVSNAKNNCHKAPVTSLAVCNVFTGCLSLNVLVYFKHWALIANSQFASQSFIFSVHETGKTHFHHPVRCQQWLSIARHSLSRNCLCTAHARQGGEIAFVRWGSMYFFDVFPVHHIWINYFEICINYFVICMIYELSSARV